MGSTDYSCIALQFNEYINDQNINGISNLMTEDHRFIDRAGNIISGKDIMTTAWIRFFELFPEYQNTFERFEARGNLVILYDSATWKKGDAPDYVIWTATIENGPVAEWRIYEDTEDNKNKFSLIV